MSVEVRGVQVLKHPPDGRLRRKGLSHLQSHLRCTVFSALLGCSGR